MKKMKKIASIILAMVMALVMAVPAFATTPGTGTTGTGTITIQNTVKGATYNVYKIFNATFADENHSQVAYTYVGTKETLDSVPGLADYFTFEKSKIEANTWVVTAKEALNSMPKEARVALKTLAEQSSAVKTEPGTGSAVEITGLEYGYYLITSTLDTSEDAVVAIDSTNPNASMYEKNVDTPTWEGNGKKITEVAGVKIESDATEKSAAYGDMITFELSVKTQNYAEENGTYKQIKEYVIDDTYPSNAFEEVTLGETYIMRGTTKVSVTPAAQMSNITGGKRFTVQWADDKDGDGQYTSKYEANDVLYITYTAKLVNTADIAGEGNTNTAKLSWTYTDDTPGNPDDDTKTETVYTYALGIDKYETGSTDKKLADAEFQLKAGDKFVKATTTDTLGVYEYAGVTENANEATTFVTNSQGQILVKGVKNVEYTIIETKAPDGYNKLTEGKTVTPAKAGSTTKYYTITEEGKTVVTKTETENQEIGFNSVLVEVANNAGSLLPSTGGIGTTIFYIIGGILVVGAAVLLVTKKRMSKEV